MPNLSTVQPYCQFIPGFFWTPPVMHHASGVAMHVMHQYAANCQYDASWPGWRWWCRRWKLCADTLMHHGSPEARHNCVPVSALVSGPWHGQFSGAQQPWVSWRNWPGRGGDTEILRIQWYSYLRSENTDTLVIVRCEAGRVLDLVMLPWDKIRIMKI